MSLTVNELRGLLLSVEGLPDDEVERLGRDEYARHYLLDGGPRAWPAHDGQDVLFFPDAFDHAFFASTDRARHPDRKNRIARDRVERVRWIKEVIAGNVEGSACWETHERRDGRAGRRHYAIQTDVYVVWLVARRDGGYRFETAYPALHEDLSRYARNAKRIWSRK